MVILATLKAAKDDFFLAVCRHLQRAHGHQTVLASLASATTGRGGTSDQIRHTWSEVRSLRKAAQMKAVLLERSDLFAIGNKEDGHPIVALRSVAVELDFSGQLPERLLEGDLEAEVGGGIPTEVQAVARQPVVASKKRKAGKGEAGAVSKILKTGNSYAPERGKGVYYDIVWTPEIAEQKKQARKKDGEMARALFEAVQSYDGEAKVSFLGSDYQVCQLKKEAQFKNVKILEFVMQYEDVFEVVPDREMSGQFLVKIQPGGEAGLPDAEERLNSEITELELLLPERIKDPQSEKERLQALRIELLHAVTQRGGRSTTADLGQDPRLQRLRQNLWQAKTLGTFIALFPKNFAVEREVDSRTLNSIVTVTDYDVSDQRMIEWSVRQNQAWHSQNAQPWRPALATKLHQLPPLKPPLKLHQPPKVVPARFDVKPR